MENLLLILVIILLLALLAGIGAIVFLGHRFLSLKEKENLPAVSENSSENKTEDQEEQAAAKEGILEKKPFRSGVGADILKALKSQQGKSLYCEDHPDMMAIGRCAISGESLCEHCLTKQKEIKVAKKYLDLYLDSEWVEVAMLPNQEISQDAAERIVKVKETLWQAESRPMIVQGHFKINVISDKIEAFTVIIARKDDSDYIRKELSFIQHAASAKR